MYNKLIKNVRYLGMTMKICIKNQYIDKFDNFINTLPEDAIKVDILNDNSISFDEAKQKVKKAINNISLNQGLDIDSAFKKILNS